MKIGLLCCDCDGTLVDIAPVYRRTNQETARRFGITLPDSFSSRSLWGSWRLACDYGFSKDFDTWSKTNQLLFSEYLHLATARPGALELWHRAKELGIALAVVSNTFREQVETYLKLLGIYDDVLTIVTREDVRFRKPHREPFTLAAKRAGVNPRECVAIDDTPDGARSALIAGMRVIGWPLSPDTKFASGILKLDAEESPTAILEHWRQEPDRIFRMRQVPIAVQIRLARLKDGSKAILRTTESKIRRR